MDEHGSDCKSTNYIDIKLTNENYSLFKDRYIVKGKDLVLLTDENKDKYINTNCKFRSPMFCINKNGICNKCAGELYYSLGIKSVGLIMNLIGGALVTLSLKKFHNMSVSLTDIDFDKYLD